MALTSDRNTPVRGGNLFSFSVAASSVIYAGSMVALNSSGYAVAPSEITGLTLVGRAEEQVDNSSGLDGAVGILVRAGIYRWGNSAAADAITRAEIGQACYAVDGGTVAKTNGGGTRSPAGIVVDVDATGVWVATGWHQVAVAEGGLLAAQNLSDITDTATARNNLGVYGPFTATLTGITSPIATNVTAEDTFTVAGIAAGDALLGQSVSGSQDGAVHDLRVSGTDEITVRTVNAAGATLTFATAPIVTFAVLRTA